MSVKSYGEKQGWKQLGKATMTDVSSVTFSNIPQDYTELVLVVSNVYASGSSETSLRINGISTTKYDYIMTDHSGSTVTTIATSTANALGINATNPSQDVSSRALIRFPGYSLPDNALHLIQSHYAQNDTAHGTVIVNGTCRGTGAAISSVTLLCSGSAIWLGSSATATLYGVM